MAGEFAGVVLPDNIGAAPEAPQEVQVSEPKGEELSGSDTTQPREAAQSQTTDLVDLDKLERFRFGGREVTLKELRSAQLRHDDYTRKTQEVAQQRAEATEARKYADNFAADLEFVLGDPGNRIAQMKGVYPAEYVRLAEQAVSRLSTTRAEGQVDPSRSNVSQLPPEMQAALKEIGDWKAQVQEQTTQAVLTQLEGLHSSLGSKFPYADPDVIDTRVSIAIEKGLKVDKGNLTAIYEKAYKEHHAAVEKRLQLQQKSKVEEQVKAGKTARDIGAGGSTPGLKPKKYKSLNEVDQDLQAQFASK